MKSKKLLLYFSCLLMLTFIISCTTQDQKSTAKKQIPEPQYFLTKDQTHNKFSKNIPPVLKVPSGAVIEAQTEEAADEEIKPGSGVEDLVNMNSDLVHPITGPVYVEGAEPGDVILW